MKHLRKEHNFIYLTVGLVLLAFVAALLDEFAGGIGVFVIQPLTVLTLALGLGSIHTDRRWFRRGLVLLVAIAVTTVDVLIPGLMGLQYLHLLFMLCFFCLMLWLAARQVLFSGRIDINAIVGSICIYLLLGMIWADLFLLVEQALPDSFTELDAVHWSKNFADLIYFSFITLTTIGYGDITPDGPIVRLFAYTEGIVGQFYIAVVVASLVSAHISARQESRTEHTQEQSLQK